MTIREKINFLEALEDVIAAVNNKMEWYMEFDNTGYAIEPFEDEYKVAHYDALKKVKAILEKASNV